MEDLVFKKYSFKVVNKKYSVLDEFCDYYGWGVYKRNYYYVLYDEQTGDIVETFDDYKTLITRICGRALDYYCEEQEYDDNTMNRNEYLYILQLIFLYKNNYYATDNNVWLDSKIKWLNNMEIE